MVDTSDLEADTDTANKVQLKSVREASVEEVEEIWSLAFVKFKEPDNLAKFEQAAKAMKESTKASDKSRAQEDLLRFVDSIFSSILTGKGFKQMGVTGFIRSTRHVKSPKKLQFMLDLVKIMEGDTSDLEADTGTASKDDVHNTTAVAESVLQITEEVTVKKVIKTAPEGKSTSQTGPAVVNKTVTEPSHQDAVSIGNVVGTSESDHVGLAHDREGTIAKEASQDVAEDEDEADPDSREDHEMEDR